MTRTLELLERLVAFPTVSSESNLALIDWAEQILRDAGFAVTRIPAPSGHKAGLHARIGPHGGGGICLSGHTDVVPTEGQAWSSDPFKLRKADGRVFGRGTTDMKGFVASALSLASRVDPLQLTAPLSLVMSYDEEIGCVGVREMLPTLTPLLEQPRLVIVGEPTSMQVAVGHKGKSVMQVTCRGEAGHSAMAPHFVNAIDVAAEFVIEMRGLQEKLAKSETDDGYAVPYSTVHVGRISGGRALNMVPDRATLDMEIRHLPHLESETLVAAVCEVANEIGIKFDNQDAVTVNEVNAYPGLGSRHRSDTLSLAHQLSGQTVTTHVSFGTEAGFFQSLGLETVVIGPGDMSTDGHKPNESLSLEELSACDTMMDRILGALGGTARTS